jgi:hypothetical protein
MAVNRWILPSILLAVFLGSLLFSRHTAWDDDELQHAHMSVLIAKGQVPHRDFFEHHLPLYHILHAPFMANADGPDDLLRLRSFSVAYLLISLVLAARVMSLRTGTAPTPILLWTALSPIFLFKMVEARPESLALAFAMASLYALSLKTVRPAWSGFFIAAMVLSSQKFIFLGFGLGLICLVENGWKPSLRLIAGGLPLPLLYLIGLLATHSLTPAWQQLVVMNSQWQESFSPMMYGGLLWRTSGLLILLALLGILSRKNAAALLLLGSGLLGVILVPIPYRQTLLMLYPGLMLAAASGWLICREGLETGRVRSVALSSLATLGILPGLHHLITELPHSLDDDVALMQNVNAYTQGPVFDGRGLLFWRGHVGYYPWIHHGLMQMLDHENYAAQTRDALIQSGFPPVLRDYRSELFPESLQTFLENHYLESEIPGLLMPGITLDRSQLMGKGTTWNVPVSGTWNASWTGGTVFLNDESLTNGQDLDIAAGPVRLHAKGFVREFRLIQTGAQP